MRGLFVELFQPSLHIFTLHFDAPGSLPMQPKVKTIFFLSSNWKYHKTQWTRESKLFAYRIKRSIPGPPVNFEIKDDVTYDRLAWLPRAQPTLFLPLVLNSRLTSRSGSNLSRMEFLIPVAGNTLSKKDVTQDLIVRECREQGDARAAAKSIAAPLNFYSRSSTDDTRILYSRASLNFQ